MADIYKVNARIAYSYSNRSDKAKIIKEYKKGSEVTVYDKYAGKWDGHNNIQYGNISKKGNEWIVMQYLTKISTNADGSIDVATSETSTINEQSAKGNAQEIRDEVANDTVYGENNSAYDKILLKYIHAFGSPPRYTSDVDPRYGVSGEINVGRAMASTWYSHPSILSLCPGTVDYLPGFSRKKKDVFFSKISANVGGGIKSAIARDYNLEANGQLYAFRSAYRDYMNIVNLLARTAANYLGIGDETGLFFGSNISLNKFDYGYYTEAKRSQGQPSIFEETKTAITSSAVSDAAYIHFFLNQAGVSAGDEFNTSASNSILEDKFGGESNVSQLFQNFQFLFGGAIGGDVATSDLEAILQEASSSSELLGSFTNITRNYLKGGRLVFPKMISGMDYSKSISVEANFVSLYGDRKSIFKYTILPAIHLLAMASPKQLASNMYTYPFLVRAYEKGNMNTDLAFISNITFNRGGSDNKSWTVDGLPTEINVRFTITPLYTNMMVTSARNPFLFMQNTALMEYLGTMCGLDLKANNLNVKVDLAKNMIKNAVSDTPTSIARGITDSKFVNEIRKFTQITF